MQQFRDRVRQSAGTDVVEGHDRVVRPERAATFDQFLAAALHLGVVALHRREIELGARVPARDRAGRAAAEPDQHRRPAEHDHGVARLQRALRDVVDAQVREPAGQHDRLVVTAGEARFAAVDLEAAEVAGQRRAPELVVEGGGADRPVAHDLEGARHPRRQRARGLPGPRQARDAQVRDGKADETGLGLRAATGRTLVADLAARTGRRARIGRDRGRMVVGLDLDRVGDRLGRAGPLARARVRGEAHALVAGDDGGIVRIRRQRVRRRRRVRVPDHLEQRLGLRHAVDREPGIEDLVPAVLGVRLREHHQFRIGRIALQASVVCGQVLDLVGRQREAQRAVGVRERRDRVRSQRDVPERPRLATLEDARRSVEAGQHRLGHRVRDDRERRGERAGIRAVEASHRDPRAALDPAHRQAAADQDLGGLRRPRRQRPEPRHDQPLVGAERRGGTGGLEDPEHPVRIDAPQRAGIDQVQEARRQDADRQPGGLEPGVQPIDPERRQGGLPIEKQHGGHGATGGPSF